MNDISDISVNANALDSLFAETSDETREQETQLRRELEAAAGRLRESALLIGRALRKYKKIVPWGRWGDFLKAISLEERSVRRWVNYAKATDSVSPEMLNALTMRGVHIRSSMRNEDMAAVQAAAELVKSDKMSALTPAVIAERAISRTGHPGRSHTARLTWGKPGRESSKTLLRRGVRQLLDEGLPPKEILDLLNDIIAEEFAKCSPVAPGTSGRRSQSEGADNPLSRTA